MLVTDESIMSIKNEIYHLIGSTNVETFAIPIDAHFCREHSVEHEFLKFLKCFGHLCFDHVYTIHDFDPCAYFVCRLCDRPPAADSVSVTFLQNVWVVFINLFDQFIDRILIITLTHVIIKNCHHSFDVHIIQNLVDKIVLQFVPVDDVVSH